MPAAVTGDTLVAPYGDLAAVEALFAAHGKEIAAVFVEPIAGNMGVVLAPGGYLEGLRRLCSDLGALLVFDEVMTGFRVLPGGVQELFGITPDLTTMGKVIGGGLNIGAYGGPRDLMLRIAPAGPVYQAGTLSGSPLAVAAGLATLEQLAADDFAIHGRLEETSARLAFGIENAAAKAGVPARVQRIGSMLGVFLTGDPVWTLADVDASDRAGFARLFHALLDAGVHLPPSPYETLFVSAAHGEAEIAATVDAFETAFAAVAAQQ